jgi:tetratricopeptide (TPR) repeat protein
MKTNGLKATFIVLLTMAYTIQVLAQKGSEDGSKFGKGMDSVLCIRNISLYSEFYKNGDYFDAIVPWREIFKDCPASRESMYANGVNMYKAFIETETDPVKKAAFCDTIMMIYDQRIRYFGGEGVLLGRKGVDLLRYRREDGNSYIQEAYNCLLRSVEIEKDKSSPVVLTSLVSASISLCLRNLNSKEKLVQDYLLATEILEKQLSANPLENVREAKDAIDLGILKSKALSCELIVKIFQPDLPEKQNDTEFLRTVALFLSNSECDGEVLFTNTVQKLYSIKPSSFSAYMMARVCIQKKEFENCVKYYKEAIDLSNSADEKSLYLFQLAFIMNSQLQQSSSAASCVLEAIKLKPKWGEAYILLGSIYGSASGTFEDAFLKKTVYWLAVDMFQKAKSVDAGVAEKANSLITEYTAYFPSVEDVFFNSLKEGQTFTIGGWINKSTVVRARK